MDESESTVHCCKAREKLLRKFERPAYFPYVAVAVVESVPVAVDAAGAGTAEAAGDSGGSGKRTVGVPAVAVAAVVVAGVVVGVAAGDRVAGGSGAGPGMC